MAGQRILTTDYADFKDLSSVVPQGQRKINTDLLFLVPWCLSGKWLRIDFSFSVVLPGGLERFAFGWDGSRVDVLATEKARTIRVVFDSQN